MFAGLSRLRLLSVLLTFVLVAPPLGGHLSAHLAAPAADRCHAIRIVRLSALGALDMRDEPHRGVLGTATP